MEQLYNPDLMPDTDLLATFVGRGRLVDDLEGLLRHQPDGAGVQHAVIIGPRGMGKTTILLVIRLRLQQGDLADAWQAVRFPEESYRITDLAELWLEALSILASETRDPSIAQTVERLRRQYHKSDDLQEAAYAAIKDWSRLHSRRLALLIDNLDMLLEQIGNEQENARLRQVLMNDGTIMLIGGATTFFQEARNHDQPLYNFFRILHLDPLNSADVEELLRQRARLDGAGGFEAALQGNRRRLQVLEYFTGGNPRLVLMLYRVCAHSDVVEAMSAMETLLDEVTPYYKAKVESLSPQQRKILDCIARATSRTREGESPQAIAEAARVTPASVGSQLKRLTDLGYVRSADIRGRSRYYTLSEPLYAIWHQMRFGREARDRIQWLVEFLKGYYTQEELKDHYRRLGRHFEELSQTGSSTLAKKVLDNQRYLLQAVADPVFRIRAAVDLAKGHLWISGVPAAVRDSAKAILEAAGEIDVGDPAAALRTLERVPEIPQVWALRGLALAGLGRHEEATKILGDASNAAPQDSFVRLARGSALRAAERYDEALVQYDHALEISSQAHGAWSGRGESLVALGRLDEGLASYDRALEIAPEDHATWHNRGLALERLGRYDEAVASFDRALQVSSTVGTWIYRGLALRYLGRHEETLQSLDRALEIGPENGPMRVVRGLALMYLRRYEEALSSFDRASTLSPGSRIMWVPRGLALMALGQREEAIRSFDKALQLDPDNTSTWILGVTAIGALGCHEKALTSLESEFDWAPDPGQDVRVHLARAVLELALNHIADAAREWRLAASDANGEPWWIERGTPLLLGAASQVGLAPVRQLLESSGTVDQFFPLARAIDFLLSGDEALLEKLSPELQPLVKLLVDQLRPLAGQMTSKSGNRPLHQGRRRSSRIRKQLS